MTTTIDTDGRATGDVTATRVLDLQRGDVIQISWAPDDLTEVLLTTPIDGTPNALVVLRGGDTEKTAADTLYQVVTGERAERWRAHRDAAARRDQFCDQLQSLVDRFRERELPMAREYIPAYLGVDVDSEADVVQAAKTLGVEVTRTEHTVAAELRGQHGLVVRFEWYQRLADVGDAEAAA